MDGYSSGWAFLGWRTLVVSTAFAQCWLMTPVSGWYLSRIILIVYTAASTLILWETAVLNQSQAALHTRRAVTRSPPRALVDPSLPMTAEWFACMHNNKAILRPCKWRVLAGHYCNHSFLRRKVDQQPIAHAGPSNTVSWPLQPLTKPVHLVNLLM